MNDLNVFSFGYLPWGYIPNWWHNIKQFFRNIKYAYQRMTKGYCDQDIWGLSDYYTQLMANSLREYNKNRMGYPGDFTDEEWGKEVEEIAQLLDNSREDYEDSFYYKKVWDNFDKMCGYIESTEFVPYEEGCCRMVENYTDEDAYNKAREEWLKAEEDFYIFRTAEKNKALDKLKENWFSLWD